MGQKTKKTGTGPAKDKQEMEQQISSLKGEIRKIKESLPVASMTPIPKLPRNFPQSDVNPDNRLTKKQEKKLKLLLNPRYVLDPHVLAWLKLVQRPFDAQTEYQGENITIPSFMDLIPCPLTTVKNWGSTNVTLTAAAQAAQVWFWPDGIARVIGEGDIRFESFNLDVNSATTGQNYMVGPIVDNNFAGNQSIGIPLAGVFNTPAATAPQFGAVSGLNTSATATMKDIRWDSLNSPFTLVGNGVDEAKFRTTAFGFRVTYTGPLSGASGFVDIYQLYEEPSDEDTWESLKRSPGYSRHYFEETRSVYCFLYPNCHTPDWRPVVNPTVSTSIQPSRVMMQIFDADAANANKSFQIDFICFQEFESHKLLSTNRSGYQTPDVASMNNGIVNAYSKSGNSKNIVGEVAQHKTDAHPFLSQVGHVLKEGFQAIGGVPGAIGLISAMAA